MGRKSRVPGNRTIVPAHSLTRAERGVNRHAPGDYRCSCGDKFTGINAFEAHRAEERRQEAEADD